METNLFLGAGRVPSETEYDSGLAAIGNDAAGKLKLGRRALVAGGMAALLLPGAAAKALQKTESSRPVARGRSATIWDAFLNYPYIKQASGMPVWVITRQGCEFSQKMFRDFPTPPDGLHLAYVVIPSAEAPKMALLQLFAERTPQAYARFMRGDYDGLGDRLIGKRRDGFRTVVEHWRGVERALSSARLRATTPMFFYGSRDQLYSYRGYEPRIISYLQEIARGERPAR